jgi:predicted nucleic acid-binding protein
LWELTEQSHPVQNATTTELPFGVSLVEKDAPVLLAAISARADILVSGDKRHFNHLFGKTIEGVRVEFFPQFASRYPDVFKPAEQDGR